MSRRQRVRLAAAAALTLANAVMIRKGEEFYEGNKDILRTPFDVENYENQYNHFNIVRSR